MRTLAQKPEVGDGMKPDPLKKTFIIEVGYKEEVKRVWKDVAWSFIYRFEEKLRDMIEDIEVMEDIIQDVNDEFNLKLENPLDIGSEFYIKLTEVKPNDTNRMIIKPILMKKLNWLLKEIEKEIKRRKKIAKKLEEEYDWRGRDAQNGVAYGLKIAKDLIKKAFEGVVRE